MNSEMKMPIAVGLGAVASLAVLFFYKPGNKWCISRLSCLWRDEWNLFALAQGCCSSNRSTNAPSTRYYWVSTRWFLRLSAFGFCELGIEGVNDQVVSSGRCNEIVVGGVFVYLSNPQGTRVTWSERCREPNRWPYQRYDIRCKIMVSGR